MDGPQPYIRKGIMKRITSIIALVALTTICHQTPTASAQTQLTAYQPGVNQNGAVYFLPKNAVRVDLLIEKTSYTPGDFCRYAQRYLRLNNVQEEASVDYRLINIEQTAAATPDSTKAFTVKFNNKTAAINVALSEDGLLQAINAQPTALPRPTTFKAAPKPQLPNPRQFMTEEIVAAGSTAKMAELTAQEIYDLRDNQKMLIKGQADFMPQDGAQMRLMLSKMEEQDQALTSLFAGITTRDTIQQTLYVCPDSTMTQPRLLFRFSKHLGLVDADDLAGVPYYILIENLSSLPPTNELEALKKKKVANGLYVNVPGKMRSTLYCGNEQLATDEFPAAQFGNVELLSGDLFNKHYGTRLWLSPLTGAVERLEAEQPK